MRTLDIVNLRAVPAGQVLGQLPQAPCSPRDLIFVMAGGVPHWAVRGPINGATVDGWLPSTRPRASSCLRRMCPYRRTGARLAGGACQPGDTVRTTTTVRMRRRLPAYLSSRRPTRCARPTRRDAHRTGRSGTCRPNDLVAVELACARRPFAQRLDGPGALANGDAARVGARNLRPCQHRRRPYLHARRPLRHDHHRAPARTSGVSAAPEDIIARSCWGVEGAVLSGPEDDVSSGGRCIADPAGRACSRGGWRSAPPTANAHGHGARHRHAARHLPSWRPGPDDRFRQRAPLTRRGQQAWCDDVLVRSCPAAPSSSSMAAAGRWPSLVAAPAASSCPAAKCAAGWLRRRRPPAFLLRYAPSCRYGRFPDPLTGAHLTAPMRAFDISQLWGENADYLQPLLLRRCRCSATTVSTSGAAGRDAGAGGRRRRGAAGWIPSRTAAATMLLRHPIGRVDLRSPVWR